MVEGGLIQFTLWAALHLFFCLTACYILRLENNSLKIYTDFLRVLKHKNYIFTIATCAKRLRKHETHILCNTRKNELHNNWHNKKTLSEHMISGVDYSVVK